MSFSTSSHVIPGINLLSMISSLQAQNHPNFQEPDLLTLIHLLYTAELKTLYCIIICSAEDLFTWNSNKFKIVYKVDGDPQHDSCDLSMCSNILNPIRDRKNQFWHSDVILNLPKQIKCYF